MEELFVTKIQINRVRHLVDFEIPLSSKERKHLILTGRNGSGKTSVLEDLGQLLGSIMIPEMEDGQSYFSSIAGIQLADDSALSSGGLTGESSSPATFRPLSIFLSTPDWESTSQILFKNYVFAYFIAKRSPKFEQPSGITKIPYDKWQYTKEKYGPKFVQHLVNLKADQAFAGQENESKEAERIENWFKKLEANLHFLLDSDRVQLQFNRATYQFLISEPGKQPYDFNTLSDGYAAIMDILSELIMRIELQGSKSYDIQGIVLIDEIETHLHIDLQKKVMAFLTNLFPRIQFIVTTHSPFVLASVQNAVICDLEKRTVTEDLSGYSSEMIVESYFGMDKYSQILKSQVDEYEALVAKESPSLEEEDRIDELKSYFDTLPKYLSDELTIKLQQIGLKHLKPQK